MFDNILALLDGINSLSESIELGERKRAELAESPENFSNKTFDWNKAAEILRDRKTQNARAGLMEDYDSTNGAILVDGVPVTEPEPKLYLYSFWATPVLVIDDEQIECWTSPEEAQQRWGYEQGETARVMWPQSALDIFNGKTIVIRQSDEVTNASVVNNG